VLAVQQDPPLCKCHGEPMGPNGSRRWRCLIKKRENEIRSYQANPEKYREKARLWRETNPEKHREKLARRIMFGRTYIGSVGFTDKERQAMVDGAS